MRRTASPLRVGISLVFAGLVGVLNPALACSSEEQVHRWEFDEADLRDAIEGTYVLRVVETNERVTITVRQASGSMRRLQCGNAYRSFVQDAGACLALYQTEMALEATIDSEAQQLPSGMYAGGISFTGRSLDHGEGDVYFSVRTEFDLQTLYRDDSLSSWQLRLPEGEWLILALDPTDASGDAGYVAPGE